MKISLFLMTEKGFTVLDSIIKNNFSLLIEKVIIGEDKSVLNDYSEDIIELCKNANINYLMYNQDYEINTKFALSISWRWLIRIDEVKLITLHDSLLPKYRGFAPLVNSLINKENYIGVTALLASSEYDKGNIIFQKKLSIEYPIKIQEAIEKISKLYAIIVLEIIEIVKRGKAIESFPQNEEEASYSLWRDEKDYFINWSMTAMYIHRFVDAVGYPYNGAKCIISNEIVRIIRSTIIKDLKIENRDVGKVIFNNNDRPVVVCGKGLLRIDEAYFEKSKVSIFPLKKFRTKFE